MVKLLQRCLLLLFILPAVLKADQVAVSSFKYLNNNENPIIIDPSTAQDLLNVDVTPGGKSVKKRSGYGLYKTLGTTQGLHGGFHFFDTTGNDVQVWGSSTSLYGISNDGTPIQIISSATLNSTWDCADIQGSLYCVDSNRDGLIKTNGTTFSSWAALNGSIVESTPDRLVVAGVTGALNSLYVSASNNFTSFTVGPLVTDAFIEPIASPGSNITHTRWACGKLLWWKNQSFGYIDFQDQYTLTNQIISDNIGTFDNTSAIDPGGSVWFRGQDGHIWRYDCSALTKESIDITPTVVVSARRTGNSWTQTSQSDFQAGSSSPTNNLSTNISAGDVVPSTFAVTENTSTPWLLGTASNMAVGTSSITLSRNNSGNINDPSFEGGSGASFAANWTTIGTWARTTGQTRSCTLNPQSGSAYAYLFGGSSLVFDVIVGTGGVGSSATILGEAIMSINSTPCTWDLYTYTDNSLAGQRVRFQWRNGTASYLYTTESYIFSGSVSFYYNRNISGEISASVDNILLGSSTITTGSFTSQAINTGLAYGFVYTSATWTVNGLTPSFILQKGATSAGPWYEVTASSGGNVQIDRPYVRYITSMTVTSSVNALSQFQGANIVARSSGTYYSAVRTALSLGAWGTFNPTYSGTHNFYIRSSTSPFYVLNSSPAWTAQTPGALVAASTGTYFQVVDSFTVTAATDTTPALNAFTVNWFEGNASDQAYALYFDNSIWFSVPYGAGVSSNTYVYRRDLINDGWTLYNFGAGGLLSQNSHLFFGDVAATGKIFQYGSGTSDAGNSITAYWKSKDFTGADPFLENYLSQIDTYAKTNSGQTLTATYGLNTSTTTTSYSVSLTNASQSIVQNRKMLPSGKNGYSFNLKYGDTSDSSAWELFGFRIGYAPQPYRPTQ